MEGPGEPEGSGPALGCGVESKGAAPGSGVSFEVGDTWVTATGAEGSEVSSLGTVGGAVGGSPEVSAGTGAASEVDSVGPGVAEVRSEFTQEAWAGLGGRVSGGSEATSRVEAVSGTSRGAESEVGGGSGCAGEAEGAGARAWGVVLTVVGRGLRSGHCLRAEPEERPREVIGPARPRSPATNGRAQGLVTSRVAGRLRPSQVPRLLGCLQAPPGVLR